MKRYVRVNIKNRWVTIEVPKEKLDQYYLEWFQSNFALILNTYLGCKKSLENVNELTDDDKKEIMKQMMSNVSNPFIYFIEEKLYEENFDNL